MAKKNLTLATIAAQIQKIDTRMERGFAAIADDIGEMRAAMVTKVDYHAFRQETADNFNGLRLELAAINKRLDTRDEQYQNLSGVTKEIDDLRARVKEIEKHLGLNKKIAA